MPVAVGIKGFAEEINATTSINIAIVKACAEGRLDDLRGLLVADYGVEGNALSTLTVSQVAVDQAAGAGQTKVKSEERVVDRSLSESCFYKYYMCELFFCTSYILVPDTSTWH